jgi:putative PIN family toxin of toxin-antitoxin system
MKSMVDFVCNIAYNINVKLPQIVIDTNIIISAQHSRRGASFRLMSLIGTGRFEVHLSVPLALEYEDVLSRQMLLLGLNREDVSDLVDALCALAVHHKIYYLWRPYLRDRKDELVLELAVTAECDCIITYNHSDFAGAGRFGIDVIDPKTFLQRIGELK